LAAKEIEFPWLSIFGGFFLAVGCQGQLPWRFSYIPWRFLAAKAIPFWFNVRASPKAFVSLMS